MKRPTRREREKELHRAEIMDAAESLFASKGFSGVSMREVARKAEFALGTIYRFFKGKEDLYAQIVKRRLVALSSAVDRAVSEHHDSIKRLEAFVEAKVRFFADNVAFLHLYFSEVKGASASNIRSTATAVKSTYAALLKKLAGLFEALKRQHGHDDIDPDEMAVALDGATDGFLLPQIHDRSRRISPAEILSALRRSFLARLGYST